MQDHYFTLGITNTADEKCIKANYKSLVKIYHSDLYKGKNKIWAEDKFKNINIAYETLSDPLKRKEYDNTINKSFNYKENNNNKFSNKRNRKKDNVRSKFDIKVRFVFNRYFFYLMIGFILFNGLFHQENNYFDAASKSSDGRVCRLATTGLGVLYKNKRIWDMTAKSYVREAKARGLKCGINENPIKTL